MGILDDAIREHLDLKRRHGVPEEELQRQEEEALGPARREAAQQHEEVEVAPGQTATAEADAPAPVEAAEETDLFDMEGAGHLSEPAPEPIDATAVQEGPVAEETAIREPPATDNAPFHEPPEAAEPTPVEPPPVEPPPVEPPVESPPAEPLLDGEEPVGEPGHDPEAENEEPLASDPEHDDLDVLEDTPDFLQETPEHDRLWFEQKPPRDFDFD